MLWIVNDFNEEEIRRLGSAAGISPVTAKVLLNRGIRDPEAAARFLNPRLEDLHDPFLLKDMDRAVERIKKAIKDKEKVTIYGDYDVDGITAVSILYRFLTSLGCDTGYYIPDRLGEGYGLSTEAVEKALSGGSSLLITVDCGITAVEEVDLAVKKGTDVIITDHHQCKEVLPKALAVVSPTRPDSAYPFRELAGVGVVFKLITAVCNDLSLGQAYLDFMDMVALGTVADIVLLLDENRTIVRYGLERAASSSNPGLRQLIKASGLEDRPITPWAAAFILAPRINAAGRMDSASKAVRLFITEDEEEAERIALELQEDNRLRQDTETAILGQVIEKIEEKGELCGEKVIVVEGEDWHPGVIGIVASKVVDRYYKPCILISCDKDGYARGSGRSVEGFDLFKALDSCSGLLSEYGGHVLAAGLTLRVCDIPGFRDAINRYAASVMEEDTLKPRLKIDAVIGPAEVNLGLAKELERLEPFGVGNPAPVFEYDRLVVYEARPVGGNRHLRLKLGRGDNIQPAIGFGMGEMALTLNRYEKVDVACSLEVDRWNGYERLQLNLRDVRCNWWESAEHLYYISLDRCLDLSYGHRAAEALEESLGPAYGIDNFLSQASEGRKTAILVNSLRSMNSLQKLFSRFYINIKKDVRVCYNSCEGAEEAAIRVLVNPIPGRIRLDGCERLVLYGPWVSGTYLRRLLDETGHGEVCYCPNDEEPVFDTASVVPERGDFEAVYRFLRARCKDGALMLDLCALADNMNAEGSPGINYFKVKKCLEIFEELGLVKVAKVNAESVLITGVYTGREKVSIEKSKIYQALKTLENQQGCRGN